ncbi:hypothetical protein EHP00_1054 [Ecytonucleospora hepatopenaei]|uniref:Non-structural maintenance of chromosome element 4 C-terminal domain-containing protein n=1 Tax=Ecytonucleospora hepatopenaei TaxID=646526 RepID=A0A1W0E5G2_9MICR|nr:hypothetical protein EHP00_1054 [Ecytonucleospora hepatopenaei]
MEKDLEIKEFIENIPFDYSKISMWLSENKKLFINKPRLFSAVLSRLDQMLKNSQTIFDLKKDMGVLIQTIQLEKEALLKEFNSNFTEEKFIEFINEGKAEDFFILCHKNEKTCFFTDVLYIDFEIKTNQKTIRKTEINTKKQKTADTQIISKEDNSETNKAIEDLKKYIEKNNFITFEEYILDRKSFSKTIFNTFNVSVALKMKYVSIKKENNILYLTKYKEDDKKGNVHGVFSITKNKWLEMCKTKDTK